MSYSQVTRGWDLVGQFGNTADLDRWFSVVNHGFEGSPRLTLPTLKRVWHVREELGASAARTTHPVVRAADRILNQLVPPELSLPIRLHMISSVVLQLLLAGADRPAVEQVAVVEQRSERSWHLPDAEVTADGAPAATIPCWPSRQSWLATVEREIASASGAAALAEHSVTADRVAQVARVCAEAADGRTGRHCTLAHASIAAQAGVSESVSKRVRRVLTSMGLAVTLVVGRRLTTAEIDAAARHHGGVQRGVASDLALTIPVGMVPADPLPSRGSSKISSSVPEELTKRARRAREQARTPKKSTSKRPGAVRSISMAVKRLVAGLLRRCRGLEVGVGRLSRIWRVVAASGIDAGRWSAADVVAELNRDAREASITWPDRIDRPEAYLAWRLGRIDWDTAIPASEPPADWTTPAAHTARSDHHAPTADRHRARNPEQRAAHLERPMAPTREFSVAQTVVTTRIGTREESGHGPVHVRVRGPVSTGTSTPLVGEYASESKPSSEAFRRDIYRRPSDSIGVGLIANI
ncbi:hypothetical protein [Gordonia malaquae]|uniref:hypothetical protein n=1 Tax=Gordonia malaquae TaxID=410332 RepID=UPI003019571B